MNMGNIPTRESQYELYRTLKLHTKDITALRFNRDGTLLASGGSDSLLHIWKISSGKCVKTISNTVTGVVTDIRWVDNTKQETGLIFSCADGSLHTYIQKKDFTFEGAVITCAHDSAIEAIASDPVYKRIATAGGGEVKVWNLNPDWTMSLHTILISPVDTRVTCCTLHFFNKGRSFMVSYLELRLVVTWNVDPWRKLWEEEIPCLIGHMALSPDEKTIIINNLKDGTECYAMPNMTRLSVFPVPMSVLRPKQVTFDSTGNFVIQGSDKGLVYIYNFDNPVMTQSLLHSDFKEAYVPIITSSSYGNNHWIASGCATDSPAIKVWKLKPPQQDEIYAYIAILIITIGIIIYTQPFLLLIPTNLSQSPSGSLSTHLGTINVSKSMFNASTIKEAGSTGIITGSKEADLESTGLTTGPGKEEESTGMTSTSTPAIFFETMDTTELDSI